VLISAKYESTQKGKQSGSSFLLALQRLLATIKSSHPFSTHGHFLTNPGVTEVVSVESILVLDKIVPKFRVWEHVEP
jgi:hypothetical protein